MVDTANQSEKVESGNNGEKIGASNAGEKVASTDNGEKLSSTNGGENIKSGNDGDKISSTNDGEKINSANDDEQIPTCTAIVVGAGLSGLTAATLLEEHDIDTIVLEASDRIGGQIHTIQFPWIQNEQVVHADLGAANLMTSHTSMVQLVKDLELETYAPYQEGNNVHYRKGRLSSYPSTHPPPLRGLGAGWGMRRAFRELDRMAQQVPKEQPWKAPNARKWDAMTVEEWSRRHIWTQAARDQISQLCRLQFGVQPQEVSLLNLLWRIRLTWPLSGGGDRSSRVIVGGMQQVPEAMAKKLKGGVMLKDAVSRIEHTSLGCTVTTQAHKTYQADFVILAVPHTVHQSITFQPPLSADRLQLSRRSPFQPSIKTLMYYDKPYWRSRGKSGHVMVEDRGVQFPVDFAMDGCDSEAAHPCIIGVICAEKALKLSKLSKQERKQMIAGSYARLFGLEELRDSVVHYEEKDWGGEKWSGCTFMGPGTLTQLGTLLREPIGERVLLAGTMAALAWRGSVEGAILAGRSAAQRVIDELDRKYQPVQ